MSNSEATARTHLLRALVAMQFKLKDQSTILGFGWSFLNPLLMLGCLFLFFNRQLGRSIDHYALYLLVGLVHFTHFTNSTTSSTTALAVLRRLTCDTIFPKELLVLATVISCSIEFVISMVLCVLIAMVTGVPLTPALLFLPLVIVLQVMMVTWLSFLLATMYVFATDSSHIYQVLLRILFFVTPTFYSAGFLGSPVARAVVWLNPLAHVIDFSRSLILGVPAFSLSVFVVLFAVNALAIWLALGVFRKFEPVFAERL